MKDILPDILACPDCKAGVKYIAKDRQFECPLCRTRFDFHNDTPVIFSKNSQGIKISGETYYETDDSPSKISRIKKFIRKISRVTNVSVGPTLHDKLKNKYIFDSPRDSVILNLGSGTDNIIMKNNIINFDIFPHPNTDISGDGHYLPFLSDSFEGVWVCAVLEHLENPFQVASEIYRVLKPGGFVLVGAPFMYHLHGSPHDYFRYTDNGLRSVFKSFKEIECGPTHTLPTGTIIEMLSQYFSLFTNNKIIVFGISQVVKIILQPFKFIDLFLKRKSKAGILSGGFVFFGRKELN